MLKKSLIFGSVTLFLAALITLTGCPTSADDGSTEVMYGHRIYGRNVTPYAAQEVIDAAVAAGESVVLENNLTIVPPGHLNFKGARVKINGHVRFNGGIVSTADATVVWAANAYLELEGAGTPAYILRDSQKAAVTGKVNDHFLVEFVERVQDNQSTSARAAVRQFTLGLKQDFDYSTDPANGIHAKINNPSLQTLFVLDNLTIPGQARQPSGALDLVALGTVDVTGSPPRDALTVGSNGISLGTCSTLTSSTGSVDIVVAGPGTTIPNVKAVGRGFRIVQSTVGTLDIPGALTGDGTLEVLGEVENIAIGGGNGNIKFSNVADPHVLLIGSTGKVTFEGNVLSLEGDKSEIYSNVVFRGNVRTTTDLALYGNVTLLSNNAVGKTVTINTTTKQLILGANKTISLEITPTATGIPASYPILETGPAPVVLSPKGTVTLTAPTVPKDDAAVSAKKLITLGGADLEITDGVLRVAQGATFTIDGVALSTGVNSAAGVFGYLAVADGGTLAISSTSHPTNDGLFIGDTAIRGPSTIFKATGGTVTLGSDTIAGSVSGAKLAPAKGGSPSIGVAGNKILYLDQVELNLTINGGLLISAGNGKVTLSKGAKIVLKDGTGGPTEWSGISVTGGSARLNGNIVAIADDPTNAKKQSVLSLAHKGGDGEANIIAHSVALATLNNKAVFAK
ncbi:MAG: hypothetical protein LBO65_02430 [Spirochaetaceae bacterium]|jgi:hypothetical protein|nr:hypothetical protein [Spirochaetaceae bacterium]